MFVACVYVVNRFQCVVVCFNRVFLIVVYVILPHTLYVCTCMRIGWWGFVCACVCVLWWHASAVETTHTNLFVNDEYICFGSIRPLNLAVDDTATYSYDGDSERKGARCDSLQYKVLVHCVNSKSLCIVLCHATVSRNCVMHLCHAVGVGDVRCDVCNTGVMQP